MSIAIDTNILFDILLPDPDFRDSSLSLLKKYSTIDRLIISDIVYGELALQFNEKEQLNSFLSDTNIQLIPISREGLWIAAQSWKEYLLNKDERIQCSFCGHKELIKCKECNAIIKCRQHILSDFIIGGHALVESGKLITRDRGFYRSYFKNLKVIY